MKKVAVTGGLASGKTTVCQFFKNLGACVISADEVVHKLLSRDDSIIQQVVAIFGQEVTDNGTISRKKLAEIVFKDPKKLRALEAILHPAVFSEIDKAYQGASREARYKVFIAEVPLLYEAGKENAFDAVVVVDADPEVAKARSSKRNDLRRERQWPAAEKKARADYVIVNNGSTSELKRKVENLYTVLSTF